MAKFGYELSLLDVSNNMCVFLFVLTTETSRDYSGCPFSSLLLALSRLTGTLAGLDDIIKQQVATSTYFYLNTIKLGGKYVFWFVLNPEEVVLYVNIVLLQ